MPDHKRSAAEAAADAWMHAHRGQAKTDSDREAFVDGFESARATQQRLVEALRLVLPYAESRAEDLMESVAVDLAMPREGQDVETLHSIELAQVATDRWLSALNTLRDIAPELFNEAGYLVTVDLPQPGEGFNEV